MNTKVSIVKGNSREENINSALDLIKKDVNDSIRKKGKETLFVKVNTLDSKIPAACTHPEALEAVLDYFYRDFQRVIVGDNSSCFMQGPNIYAHLKTKFKNLEFSDLKDFRSEELPFEMLNDMIKVRISIPEAYTISLALPKSHDAFVFTGCSKNMVGCIIENRQSIHALKAHERLFLNNIVKSNAPANRNLVKTIKAAKPDLAILDGFTGMEGEGPALGKTVEMKIALASLDCIALDTIAARICGFENVQYIFDCIKEGIGTSEVDLVKQGFDDLNEISKKFEESSAIKYLTMEESMFPRVNAGLVKAVIRNSHPHRMAAKVLRMMLKNGLNK